jgi:hypothetical protein
MNIATNIAMNINIVTNTDERVSRSLDVKGGCGSATPHPNRGR